MEYIYHYNSPLGGITMCSDGQALTGLLFDGEKYFTETFSAETAGITECEDSNLPAFAETVRWLDIYFSGKDPGFLPPISLIIPCHRVIGTDGSLTGYAGGIDKKAKLLQLEGVEIQED